MLPALLHALAPLGASLTAGSHTLGGRGFRVVLPSGVSPAPVVICLHGNGGTGNMANDVANGNKGLADTHILVGPDGPQNSWNIKAEDSTEDDAAYIGSTLLAHLAAFDNVSPTFTLYGYSNGAALANRILIEIDDSRIVNAITDGSQLNTLQYRPNTGGSFYSGGTNNAYTQTKAPVVRRLLQITGGADGVIPATGGESAIGDGEGGKLNFVPWDDSALAYAAAWGHGGGKATPSPDDATTAKATYLSGRVVACNFKGGGHVIGPTDALARAAIAEFLGIADVAGTGGGDGGDGEEEVEQGDGSPCTQGCATEFERCINQPNPPRTYAACRQQLDQGNVAPLVNAGCVPGCADTASMATLNPSPAPSPPPPPVREGGADGEDATVVLVTWTVAGDIASVPQAAIKSAIATAANVSTTDVTLTLVAASVKIFATIAIPSTTTAAAVSAGITTNLGSASQASSSFGVTVEVAAQASTTTQSAASAQVTTAQNNANSSDGLGTGALIGIIAGGVVGAVGLITAIVCCCGKGRRGSVGQKA